MTLRVVGAGLFRTGTTSLKVALERLLGAPCHHMQEVFAYPVQRAVWQRYADGESLDWDDVFRGYAAEVDVPASLAWRELVEWSPDATVLLSTRSDPETWWRSAESTVLAAQEAGSGDMPEAREGQSLIGALIRNRFCADRSPEAMKAAYTAHNDEVRATVPADRLIDWQPGDGWEPLCAGLGLDVPDEPFPHANSTAEFRARAGLD